MDLFGTRRSTTATLLFFLIIFPLVALMVDRTPNWDEEDWEFELGNFRRKYHPEDNIGGADRPSIPELIECALKVRKEFPTCSDNFRKALLNEIVLRKQFKAHNEDCNSAGTKESELVVNPPGWPNGLDYPSYLIWQEKLIDSKVQLCDPHQFLRCSAEKRCACLSGSVRVENVCVYSHGSPCMGYIKSIFRSGDPTNIGQLYFDPFQTSDKYDRTRQTLTAKCMESSDKCYGDFRFYYYRDKSYCVDEKIFTEGDERFQLVVGFVDELLSLPFNEECNSQDQNRLFTSTKEEDEDYEVRFKTLENLHARGVKFCDFEKFLTCGRSQMCECMPPSSRIDDKCVLPDRLDKCSIDAEMEPILMNKTLVLRAREELMIGFAYSMSVSACEGNLTCQTDMVEIYCACPPGKTGLECNETLTRFLPIVRVQSLPTDVPGYPEKFKIFSDFNKAAVEFEEIFRRNEGSFCVAQIQMEAEILVGGIRRLKYRGTTTTKREYEDLGKKIQNFRIPHTRRIICNDTLRCQYSSKSCVRMTRRDYLQDLVKTLEGFKTRKCAQPDCSNFPKDFNDAMFSGNETLFYGGEHEMEYIRIIEELSKFLKKCDCRKKRVDNLSTTQSLNQFILFMSVAVFFVVTTY